MAEIGLPEHIRESIEKTVEGEGLELVNIEYRRLGRNLLLRIDIDKEGGVTLNDCENVSNQLSTYLDVEDVVPGSYELQVSSPGLDRKLVRDSDYERFLGCLVRVRTREMVGGLYVIVGHLREFDGQRIGVVDPKTKDERMYEIELANIREARLEPEF